MGELFTPEGGEIFEEPFDEALSKRYLAYALSTITQRALPDARDGLKPVHRRLLYAMRLLKLSPDEAFKKSARVVGDVIGKYHPHGDQAVYDAMVRLAQGFAARYPLVEGQGNFGNIDGDGPAAMRYTEARLTAAAELMLNGLDRGAVDFRGTYDGSESEPVVLPAAFPNLLANGSTGIAVGMATSIPPHNAAELCAAARRLIARPEVETAELLTLVKGPDFPTGGVCVEPAESIAEAYETGRGGFRVRARWFAEEFLGGEWRAVDPKKAGDDLDAYLNGRNKWRLVVDQIPYQIPKSRLIERIAQLMEARKLPLLDDVRDESAEDVRVVLEPKTRLISANMLMESLFKLTELEARFPLNLNVLDGQGAPRVMGLKEALRIWLDHRRVVTVRLAQARLDQVEDRLEILAGYLVVYADIDEVIRIIRFEDEPKQALMARFTLSERQAEAILNMRLRALRKLEELAIRKEETALKAERKSLKSLLASEAEQWAKVDADIAEVEQAFGPDTALGARRTNFSDAPQADAGAVAEALIVREAVTAVLSEKGWIRTLKGHAQDLSAIAFKEGDRAAFAVRCETTDKLLLFVTDGKFYALDASKLPGGRGHGEPLRLHAGLPEDAAPIALFKYEPERMLLIASRAGNGFRVKQADVFAAKRGGKQALNAGDGEAAVCAYAEGDRVAVLGENRKLLVFPLDELPEMTRGKGVRLMGGKGFRLADAACFSAEDGLGWIDGAGRRQQETDWRDWEGKRAQAGKLVPKGFPRSNRFAPKDPAAMARAENSG
ncbi:MAG: DNA topoisomerase IV subunit A [Maricaulaceae bacterium]|nr:DNA topoisomerase IV subunit A [Maricaulaceae bacterium]